MGSASSSLFFVCMNPSTAVHQHNTMFVVLLLLPELENHPSSHEHSRRFTLLWSNSKQLMLRGSVLSSPLVSPILPTCEDSLPNYP